MQKSVSFLFFILLALACKQPEDNIDALTDYGYDYYPLQIGSERTYFVDSIVYDDNGPTQAIDTFKYLFKEVVVDTFIDDAGALSFTISKYFKPLPDSITNWQFAGNNFAQQTNLTAQKIADNVREVKLIFPLRELNSWNGNLYNGRDPLLYQITQFKVPYWFNGRNANSVKVESYRVLNFIEEIYRYERFAQNIGMVEYLFDSLNTQSSGTKGLRYRLKLKLFKP